MFGYSIKPFATAPLRGSSDRKGVTGLVAFVLVLTLIYGASRALAVTSGSLDNTFGFGGVVVTDFDSGGVDQQRAMALQSDGKIVVVGFTDGLGAADFAVLRYNSDGTLDNTFGYGGKVATDIGVATGDLGLALAIQSDGKIVVAGQASGNFAVARYNSDGTLDSAFGTGGVVTTDIGTSSYDEARSVAIQTDAKIVVVGISNAGISWDMAVVRYDSDGILDNTFGTSGKVLVDFGTTNDSASAMLLQSDSKIVIAGAKDDGSGYDFALARLNSDGTLDSTFGTGGKRSNDFGLGADDIYSLALQSDNKIVAVGMVDQGPTNDFGFARYNSDGTMDNTFGENGMTTMAFAGYDAANDVVIQADGKIVAGGFGDVDFALARLNSDGTPDSTFGTGGKVTTSVTPVFEAIQSLEIQSDGKIVAAGWEQDGDSDFVLARYHAASDPVSSTTTSITSTTSTSTTTTSTITSTTEGSTTSTVAPTNTSSGTLPQTGQNSNSNTTSAMVILVAGVSLLIVARRRLAH